MIKRLINLLLILSIYFISFSQFYETGQDPSSIKWKQINTEQFQLIYPSDFNQEAQRFANILSSLYQYANGSLNISPAKISVIIHNHSLYANGYVVWAPKRMEIYPLTPQDNFSDDDLRDLAIHEFQHVIQISSLRNNITKVPSYLFGEQLVGLTS